MSRATYVQSILEQCDTIVLQGTREKMKVYFEKGYCVFQHRRKQWTMVFPHVLVTLLDETSKKIIIDMEKQIRNYYNISSITRQKYNKFSYDAQMGKIGFILNEHSKCNIVQAIHK